MGTIPCLGQFIKERRKSLGLTQADLATKIEVSQAYVADIESGKVTMPDIYLLYRLKQELNISGNIKKFIPDDYQQKLWAIIEKLIDTAIEILAEQIIELLDYSSDNCDLRKLPSNFIVFNEHTLYYVEILKKCKKASSTKDNKSSEWINLYKTYPIHEKTGKNEILKSCQDAIKGTPFEGHLTEPPSDYYEDCHLIFKVFDESMDQLRIHKDDTVQLKVDTNLNDGDIFLLRRNNELYIRQHYFMNNNSLFIPKSSNPDFKPLQFNKKTDQLIGKVLAVSHSFDIKK